MVQYITDGPEIMVELDRQEIIPNIACANPETGTYHTYEQLGDKPHPQMVHKLKSHKANIRVMNIDAAIGAGFELVS